MIDAHVGALIIAFARAAAFCGTMPLASSGVLPRIVRAGLAVSITPLAASGWDSSASLSSAVLTLKALEAAGSGALIGMAASVISGAINAAGGLVDAALASQFVGMESPTAYGRGPFAFLYSLGFGWVFVACGAYTEVVARFVCAPWNIVLRWSSANVLHAALILGRDTIAIALAIAAPALCAQVVAAAAGALLSRSAPRINGMLLNAPLTSSLVLVAVFLSHHTWMAVFMRVARGSTVAAGLTMP